MIAAPVAGDMAEVSRFEGLGVSSTAVASGMVEANRAVMKTAQLRAAIKDTIRRSALEVQEILRPCRI